MRHALAVVVMVLAAGAVPATAVTGPSNGAYAGTHVSFDVDGDAVRNYSVDDETMLASVEMRSAGDRSGWAESGSDLATMAGLDGDALSLGATTRTSATVESGRAGSLTAHDDGHGVLVFDAGDGARSVEANLGENATAERERDGIVTVRNENGTAGSFIVVGDGEVSVDETGDVSARIDGGRLVFRSYPDGRDANDERQERLIANGTAAGEVYVTEEGGELAADAVIYGTNTTMDAERTAEGDVELVVNRTTHEGTVIITSVGDGVEDADDLGVTVDGEAAAEASSYGELRGAIGGERSRYMVEEGANAGANADVLVAVNHFSTRTIGIVSGDGASSDGTTTAEGVSSDSTANESGQPGFGVGAALAALLAVAFVAIRRC